MPSAPTVPTDSARLVGDEVRRFGGFRKAARSVGKSRPFGRNWSARLVGESRPFGRARLEVML